MGHTSVSHRVRNWVRGIIVAAVVLSIAGTRHDANLAPQFWLTDFRAFYCAGRAVDAGADPYRVQPLLACERTVGEVISTNLNAVVPAPLPPFALGLFAALGQLGFGQAALVWSLLIAASLVATVVLLRGLTGLAALPVFCSVVLSVGFLSLYLGQPTAPVIALVCLAAWLLEGNRPVTAALAAALTLIEPHVGLPICLSLALWSPRTRVTLAASSIVLGAIGLAVVGAPVAVAYVRAVLPAQVLAEVHYPEQYSMTYFAARLGAPDHLAIVLGDAVFCAALLTGVTVAMTVRRSLGRPAALVLVPAAVAVAAGPYVHLAHIAAAIPAALFLFAQERRLATPLAVAIVLLAVPWGSFVLLSSSPLPLVLAVFGLLVATLFTPSFRTLVVATTAAGAGLVALRVCAVQWYHRPVLAGAIAPGVYASGAWRAFVDGTIWPQATDAAFLLAKVPTAVGVVVLLACIGRVVLGVRDPVRAAASAAPADAALLRA